MFRNALIMAAGRGMRMMPLTEFIPKPMAIFKGSTLIVNAIEQIHKQVPCINITVGYKGAELAKHVIEHGVSSIFNTEGQGNSWWIYNSLMKHVDDAVLVLTCDNVVELNLERIYSDYEKFSRPACMVVPVRPVEGLDGDFIFHDNNVVTELNRHKPTEMYCSGIQVLNPKKINDLTTPSDNFYDVWSQLIVKQQLYCSNIYPDKWFAVDTVEQLDRINKQGF
jgi:NDP-sugar pyrophosphorylase family protein